MTKIEGISTYLATAGTSEDRRTHQSAFSEGEKRAREQVAWSRDELADWQCGDVRGGRRQDAGSSAEGFWALSARALHAVWRRQEAGLETQVTARLRGGGAPRTRSQGGVREEMLPRLLGWGLNFRQQEEQDGPESRDGEGTWVDQGSGWGGVPGSI